MLVLALDTSSAAVSAALVEVTATEAVARARHTTVDARGHGEYLAPMIAACLADAFVRPDELGALVAGTGPGPFTGLRVGLVTAAVMSETLRIPAYGVCSLDALAPPVGTVLVAADARRKEVYWARYADGRRTDGPHVDRPGDVPTTGIEAMVGAGARAYADLLGLPLPLQLPDAEGRGEYDDYPDPARLVTRALDRIRAGAASDPLTPLYLRRPDAVEPGTAKPVSR